MGKIRSVKNVFVTTSLIFLACLSSIQAQQSDERFIEIASQPLASALQSFSEKSGLQLAYVATLADGVQSSGTQGPKTRNEALDAVLQGTGLQYKFINEQTIAIEPIAEEGGVTGKSQPVSNKVLLAQAGTSAEKSSGAANQTATDKSENVVESRGLIEEITVTARKRKESLQDTPISITAFSAEALEARQITDIAGIADYTPNLSFDRNAPISGASAAAIIFLRGIGQTEVIPTLDPGVGLYVDGVYVGRSIGGVIDLIDVEQVEVLRGPQGTLFGRNTIGGAINISTQKPNAEPGGALTFRGGTADRYEFEAAANAPITDSLFVKLSASSRDQDGYVKRPDGTETGDKNQISARGAVRWLVTDDITLDVSTDYTRDRTDGAPFSLSSVEESASFVGFSNNVLNAATCAPPPSPALPTCYNSQWVGARDDVDFGTDDLFSEMDVWGVSSVLNWEMDWLQVRSITSYRKTESNYSLDQDHSPVVVANTTGVFDQDQFSQEIQFLGQALDNKVNWIFGLFYFDEDSLTREDVTFSVVSLSSGGQVESKSKAVFGQVTFDVTEQISITGGVRYTKDTKGFSPDQVVTASFIPVPVGAPLLPPGKIERDYSETTFMTSIAYEWTEELMTYFTFSQGFKSGGFTQRVFPPLPAVPTFEPEIADVYEFGFKWQGFERRLRLNGAIFRTDYSDLQLTVRQAGSPAPIVLNSAEARIEGAELELMARPTEAVLIEFGGGYLNAKYLETDLGTVVTTSSRLPKVSKWMLSGAASYTHQLETWGRVIGRVDWSYRSRFFHESLNAVESLQPGYSVFNLGFTWESADELWSLIGRVENIADKRYISAANVNNVTIGRAEIVLDRGREWSIAVTRRF